MEHDISMVEEEYEYLMDKACSLRKEIGDFNTKILRFFEEYENRFGEDDTDIPAYLINKEYEKIEEVINQIMSMITNIITEFRLMKVKRKF